MIDYEARKKYADKQQLKSMVDSMFSNFSGQSQQSLTSLEKIHRKTIENLTSEQKKQQEFFDKVGKALLLIFKKIPDTVKLPDVFRVNGSVDIDTLPPVVIENLTDLQKYFSSLEKQVQNLAKQVEKLAIPKPEEPKEKLAPYFKSLESKISSLAGFIAKIPPPKITLPTQSFQIPKIELPEIKVPAYNPPEVTIDINQIIVELKNLQEILEKPQNQEDLLPVLRKIQQGINNLVTRPTMTPPAVTNVWLNPNQGFLKATDNTVGTTVTKLPSYGQLIDRRAVLIYNNSSNTIYIGGSDVTVATGLPIPANSYAPPIDAGYNLPVYAIAATNNNDCRVIEMSKDQSGTVQE